MLPIVLLIRLIGVLILLILIMTVVIGRCRGYLGSGEEAHGDGEVNMSLAAGGANLMREVE